MSRETACVWVTLLTQPAYLPGVLGLAQSLKNCASRAPLLVLVTEAISAEMRVLLDRVGCLSEEVAIIGPDPRLNQCYANARFAEVWTRLAAWRLTRYHQMVFLDADMLVLRNMDELLTMPLPDKGRGIAACHACRCNPRAIASYPSDWRPENCFYSYCHTPDMTAAPWSAEKNYFNGGLLVFRPSEAEYQAMLRRLGAIRDLSGYVFAEQDFLNDYFRGRWQALHYGYNALKTLPTQHPALWDISRVKNLHYIIDKPWERRPEPGDDYYHLHKMWWEATQPPRRRRAIGHTPLINR